MFYQMNDDFVLTFSYLTDSLEWKLFNVTLKEGNNEVKIDSNNQRRKKDLVGHGFNDDIGDKDIGQGMYKNRVKNDRNFFEIPALLFCE